MVMTQPGNTDTQMTEKVATQTTQELWRSKLGTNYQKQFMEQNEARLLKELQDIRDDRNAPENRTCADCGDRSTVWASVNLGVFLCMTCGAHHRSLGTHISLPKGCTGTYWWGPDEIEQMKSKGNAHAQRVYGKSGPPNDMNKDDVSGWKQYLTDKYVHKKFAPTAEARGGDERPLPAAPPSSSLPSSSSSPHVSPRFTQRSSKFSHTPMPDIDLIHFESNSPRSSSTIGKTSPSGASAHKKTSSSKRSSAPAMTGNTGADFFAEFGV